MRFIDKLRAAWERSGSLVCVGLDPDLKRIPAHLADGPQPIFEFCRDIADATADLVCAFKPQIAYFAAAGAETQLEALIRYLRERYPHVPVILDAKRGDIGSTADMYAAEAFDRYGADAVTANPYMGGDTLAPYLRRADRGTVVLCRTSNPGSGDFQSLDVGGEKLYERVARLAREAWNANGNVALVVGATWPEELARVRAIAGDIPLLVPGVGAQGGDVEAVVRNGLDSRGEGLIINSSRAILYAADGPGFADAAREAALQLRNEINAARGRVRAAQ